MPEPDPGRRGCTHWHSLHPALCQRPCARAHGGLHGDNSAQRGKRPAAARSHRPGGVGSRTTHHPEFPSSSKPEHHFYLGWQRWVRPHHTRGAAGDDSGGVPLSGGVRRGTGVEEATFAVLAAGFPISGTAEVPQEGITIWQEHHDTIGAWDVRGHGDLGGWSLSVHHVYDSAGQILYLGNGERRSARGALGNVITTVAGLYSGHTPSAPGFSGDGGPATQAALNEPIGVAVGPDGSLYIADSLNGRIRRVGLDGIITTVAGNPEVGVTGDGGPATQATLADPFGVAVGPDGSLYIAP
ncbi:MAG: hypothetical protein HYZ72_19435 [Deltaproteobacteria bacterium]|nr:hypothetical protein [Deltaproteobacteria bacterium]